MRATMLLSATSNGVGVNVRLVGYGLSVSRYQGIYNSICYHAVRESVAMGESLITHIRTEHNHSDLMTKVTSGCKRRRLVGGILYDIYDDHKQQ